MTDTRARYVTPSVEETAFNCPHCGAFAKQDWFRGHAEPLEPDQIPAIWTPERANSYDFGEIEEEDEKVEVKKLLDKMSAGFPFLEMNRVYVEYNLHNVYISKCFNCRDIAVWIYNSLAYPRQNEAPPANSDLPPDVLRDYREAGAILGASPRGSAALLRLCVQKICKQIGGKGLNINEDIALLVAKGLDKRVQQALDIVRVVGNNAVHPGQLDLRDDRATAEKLFSLINLIADITITQPKNVQSMFDNLPDSSKQSITRRDHPKT
jgi:hypothetical protein